MDNKKLVGMSTGALVTLMMMFLVRTDMYSDVDGNLLFGALLIFAMVMFGYGVAYLFGMTDKKPKSSKKKNKDKDKFIMED